ncbi:MAG TPA: isoprenylcysteine carboxylmethyltransferase family protein [Bacteroidota bacterium]|nr:isoprenylcysteine carboxylmethyltransferase family protein [Bacteroidota bacterium]
MKRESMNTVSVLGYALMVAGLLLLWFNRGLFCYSPVVIVLQCAAIGLMIWARATFKARSFHFSAAPTEGGLVTNGPYSFIRHPIYASVLLFIWAAVAGSFSISNVLFGCLVSAGAWLRITCEETLVRERYPEYQQYAETTKRLIPFVF